MLGQVDRIAIPGQLRKADDIGGRHGLVERLGHADRKVLEKKCPQFQHASLQAIRSPYPLFRALSPEQCAEKSAGPLVYPRCFTLPRPTNTETQPRPVPGPLCLEPFARAG